MALFDPITPDGEIENVVISLSGAAAYIVEHEGGAVAQPVWFSSDDGSAHRCREDRAGRQSELICAQAAAYGEDETLYLLRAGRLARHLDGGEEVLAELRDCAAYPSLVANGENLIIACDHQWLERRADGTMIPLPALADASMRVFSLSAVRDRTLFVVAGDPGSQLSPAIGTELQVWVQGPDDNWKHAETISTGELLPRDVYSLSADKIVAWSGAFMTLHVRETSGWRKTTKISDQVRAVRGNELLLLSVTDKLETMSLDDQTRTPIERLMTTYQAAVLDCSSTTCTEVERRALGETTVTWPCGEPARR